MSNHETVIRVKTLEEFDRELARDGDETLEVPAEIAREYGIFPEDVGSEDQIRQAQRGAETDE